MWGKEHGRKISNEQFLSLFLKLFQFRKVKKDFLRWNMNMDKHMQKIPDKQEHHNLVLSKVYCYGAWSVQFYRHMTCPPYRAKSHRVLLSMIHIMARRKMWAHIHWSMISQVIAESLFVRKVTQVHLQKCYFNIHLSDVYCLFCLIQNLFVIACRYKHELFWLLSYDYYLLESSIFLTR